MKRQGCAIIRQEFIMHRGTAASCLIGVFLIAPVLRAQAPGPTFEVATIKPAQAPNAADIMAGKLHVGMKVEAGRVDIGFLSLENLLMTAYGVKDYQISGPDWIRTERFDILAKMPEGSNKDQVPDMLKALLAERFKVAVHKETKEHSMYALVVGKGGSKLKDAPPDPDPAATPEPEGKGGQSITVNGSTVRMNQSGGGRGVTISGSQTGTTKMSMGADGMMHMEASKVSMPTFADMLTRFVDKPVVDRTDLKGNYQITLDLAMADLLRIAQKSGVMAMPPAGVAGPAPGAGGAGAANAASDPGSGGSVFTAVQALGLKLEPRKEAVDTYVVDHIEKTPTDN
ncbi:MAG: TIGR03435 family protein [Acidobacteriota bacterium]|nr:TIGR03435 family protein [Acidobacteriota bacterium]